MEPLRGTGAVLGHAALDRPPGAADRPVLPRVRVLGDGRLRLSGDRGARARRPVPLRRLLLRAHLEHPGRAAPGRRPRDHGRPRRPEAGHHLVRPGQRRRGVPGDGRHRLQVRPLATGPRRVRPRQEEGDDAADALEVAGLGRVTQALQHLGRRGQERLGAGGGPAPEGVVHDVLDRHAEARGQLGEGRHRVGRQAGGDGLAEPAARIELLWVHDATLALRRARRKGYPARWMSTESQERTAALLGAEPLVPSEGWGVVHLFLRAERGGDGGPILSAIDAFTATDPNQVIAFSVLGDRADLGLMCLGPDLDALDRLVKDVLAGPVERAGSFVSLTELSEYTPTEDQERARLEAAGEEDVDGRLAAWRARMADYNENRLHPRLPARRFIAFYPMSKRREAAGNWYALSFEERRRLMGGHAVVGRRYAGRVLQLITGATGLDDWEWGVTLLADDPSAVKEIVYEMRFDEVSASYAEFGPFWVGLAMPAREALARAGLAPA